MRRVVSLYLPTLPTDRWRRSRGQTAPSPDAPVALIARINRRQLVYAANAAALALQVRPGSPAAQARALIADLVVDEADPNGDAQALQRLAAWALRRYSPMAAADLPDGLAIDITGAAHLRGGERGVLDDLIDQAAKVGLAAKAAVAPTWGAAVACARYLADPSFIAEDLQPVLDLPIRGLRLSPEHLEGLDQLGVRTIGELNALPRAPLARRFGGDLLRRLDHTFGRMPELIRPVAIEEVVSSRRPFAEPIGAPETLARYVGELAEALCAALEAKGLGARQVDLRFHRVDNRIEAVRVGLARPMREARRLTRLLGDQLEKVDPGFGVEQMVIAATVTQPLAWKSQPHALGEAAKPDVAELIDALANRSGAERLYRASPAESEAPERSVKRVDATAPDQGGGWPLAWPRPTRLMAPPEPVDALAVLPDHPPAAFTWRGVRRRVRRADGPERIFGEWWKNDIEIHAVRDYFQVEDDEGRRYWLFRQGDGEDLTTGTQAWFLHGLFG